MQNSVPLSLGRHTRSFSLRSLIAFLSALLMLDYFFRGSGFLRVAWSSWWIIQSLFSPVTEHRMAIPQNPVHLWPIGPRNHKILPKRKPPSTHPSQIPHSETSSHTAHHRADIQRNKLPHPKHQSVPTQKYSLPTYAQDLRKVLHWKHNTIPTRSRERTFDQRQFVHEKVTS